MPKNGTIERRKRSYGILESVVPPMTTAEVRVSRLTRPDALW